MTAVIDGFETVHAGVNSMLAPSLIAPGEIAKGINLDIRGGKAKTRPAFIQHELSSDDQNALKAMREGKYQGGTTYTSGAKTYIVLGVSGRIYRIDPELCAVVDLTPESGRMSDGVDRLYFCQANEHLIVQDGQNRPIIITASVARQSAVGDDPDVPEVPVGTMMAFGQGRLFVVVDRKYIMAGDISLPWEPLSVLQFTETQYLNGGGAFGLPAWMGRITGLAFQQNVVSGSGLGSLVVFAEHGVSSFAVQNPRSTWNITDISRVLYRGSGGTGPESIVPVENDMFYLATDGLRSIKVAAGEKAGESLLTSIPLSNRIQGIMVDETPWAFHLASGILHDHRLYMTSIARKHTVKNTEGNLVEDFTFDAVMTADMNTAGVSQLAFEGLTTGLKFLQLFEVERYGRKQVVVLGKNEDAKIGFYAVEDHVMDNWHRNIPCRLCTAAYDFGASVAVDKLEYVDIWISGMRGNVGVAIYARTDGYPLWTKIGAAAFTARDASDGTENVWPQIRQKVRVSVEGITHMDEISERRNAIVGNRIQLCIDWVGTCQIDRIMLVAERQPDDTRIAYELTHDNTQLTGAALMDYEYKIEG